MILIGLGIKSKKNLLPETRKTELVLQFYVGSRQRLEPLFNVA